jgi:hypothetical protein
MMITTGGDHRALHQHRQHVLGAHQAAVEQRQTGQDHEQDEDGRHQHPGDVALVHDRRNNSRRIGNWRCGRRGGFLGKCGEGRSAQRQRPQQGRAHASGKKVENFI